MRTLLICLFVGTVAARVPVSIRNKWGNGMEGEFSIRVNKPYNGWKATITFSTNVQNIEIWKAAKSWCSGNTCEITNLGWNAQLNPGDTLAMHFVARFSGHDANPWAHIVLQGNGGQVVTDSPARTTRGANPQLRLIFEDDFNGNSLDTSKWSYEVTTNGGGNSEYQIYTPEKANTYVKDGKLYIKPTLTADKFGERFLTTGKLDLKNIYGYCTQAWNHGCYRDANTGMIMPVMSGKIKSKMTFKYGRVEVMAKMPRGDWLWPAIWFLPEPSSYGNWPVSGEIDLTESRGNRDYSNLGVQYMASTLHWGPSPSLNRHYKTHAKHRASHNTYADGMHKYVLEWDEHGIKTFVDDALVLNVRTPSNGYWGWGGFHGNNPWARGSRAAPFDKPFYLMFNVAVAGDYFPDGVASGGRRKPWSKGEHEGQVKFWQAKNDWYPTWRGEDAAMQVDYVKIWGQ